MSVEQQELNDTIVVALWLAAQLRDKMRFVGAALNEPAAVRMFERDLTLLRVWLKDQAKLQEANK